MNFIKPAFIALGLCTATSRAVVINIDTGQTDFNLIDSLPLGQGLSATISVVNPVTTLPAAAGFDVSLPIAASTISTFDTEAAGRRLLGDVLHDGGFSIELTIPFLTSFTQAVSGIAISEDPLLVAAGSDLAVTEAGLGGPAFDVTITSISLGSNPDSITIEGSLNISAAQATAFGFPALAGTNFGDFRMTGTSVPEPSSMLLASLALCAGSLRRRR